MKSTVKKKCHAFTVEETGAYPVVGSPSEYWKATITIPFLRAHYELCSLIPEVIRSKEDLQETVDSLLTKWEHLMPSGDDFHSELFRWKRHCNGISGLKICDFSSL